MAASFNMLRANDLIWSFVVSNYLLGKEPIPVRSFFLEFQLDAHASGHAFVLSTQHVSAQSPGETRRYHVADAPIDLTKIKTPTFS